MDGYDGKYRDEMKDVSIRNKVVQKIFHIQCHLLLSWVLLYTLRYPLSKSRKNSNSNPDKVLWGMCTILTWRDGCPPILTSVLSETVSPHVPSLHTVKVRPNFRSHMYRYKRKGWRHCWTVPDLSSKKSDSGSLFCISSPRFEDDRELPVTVLICGNDKV